eukprot:SAG25_NODE_947_length_4626_cov_2.304838_8_plen_107_part_00
MPAPCAVVGWLLLLLLMRGAGRGAGRGAWWLGARRAQAFAAQRAAARRARMGGDRWVVGQQPGFWEPVVAAGDGGCAAEAAAVVYALRVCRGGALSSCERLRRCEA